jgi:hypothetical protein
MPTAALAFSPLGDTISFTAATPAPPAAVQTVNNDPTRTSYQFRIINSGIVVVFLGVGATQAAAGAAALTLAAGSIPLVPGAVEVLSFPAGSWFTALSASSTAVIYVTPGEGL